MTIDWDDNAGSREYAREAERARHRLAADLDELNGRLSPGQIIDEMLTYTKSGGSTFFRSFSNASRDNPIPALLIGAGCMMFLSEKTGLNRYLASAAETGSPRVAVRRDEVGAADRLGETASSTANRVTGAVASAAGSVRDTVGNTVGTVRETAEDTLAIARETASGIADQVSAAAAMARDQTTGAARQLKDQATALLNEQPLLVAAIGLALGAAFAAALPSTEAEDQLMGETSDALKQTATEAAGQVVQQAKNLAEREGLTQEAATDAVRSVSEKIKTVATEAAAPGFDAAGGNGDAPAAKPGLP